MANDAMIEAMRRLEAVFKGCSIVPDEVPTPRPTLGFGGFTAAEWLRGRPTDFADEGDDITTEENITVSDNIFANRPETVGQSMPPGTVFRADDLKTTFTPPQPDPMVKFLEEQVAKLETRLRASEAHCRRYAVAVAGYRAAAHQGLTVLRTIAAGVEIGEDAAGVIVDDIVSDITESDKLIDPVATEVVK